MKSLGLCRFWLFVAFFLGKVCLHRESPKLPIFSTTNYRPARDVSNPARLGCRPSPKKWQRKAKTDITPRPHIEWLQLIRRARTVQVWSREGGKIGKKVSAWIWCLVCVLFLRGVWCLVCVFVSAWILCLVFFVLFLLMFSGPVPRAPLVEAVSPGSRAPLVVPRIPWCTRRPVSRPGVGDQALLLQILDRHQLLLFFFNKPQLSCNFCFTLLFLSFSYNSSPKRFLLSGFKILNLLVEELPKFFKVMGCGNTSSVTFMKCLVMGFPEQTPFAPQIHRKITAK